MHDMEVEKGGYYGVFIRGWIERGRYWWIVIWKRRRECVR